MTSSVYGQDGDRGTYVRTVACETIHEVSSSRNDDGLLGIPQHLDHLPCEGLRYAPLILHYQPALRQHLLSWA